MRLKEFLTEKKKECESDSDKYKDLDCTRDDLSDDERDWCNKKNIVNFINKSVLANN